MRGASRPFALIAVALMLLSGLPLGSAQGAPTTRDVADQAKQTANDTTSPVTSIPTVGQAYQDANALVDSSLAALTSTLRAHNLSVAGLENTTSTSVFHDDLDNASVGGVGAWRAPAPWRNDSRSGLRDSHGWTMADANGSYGAMDATLLTPAIDLSAYALANVPYLQDVAGGSGSPIPPQQRSVLLTFQTRFGFVEGKDGGEVVAYLHDPAIHADEPAFPLLLVNGQAQRDAVHALDGRTGFTNVSDWTPVTFDLTPFLGETIWIGFHVATSPQASSDPDYLTQLPPGVKAGWQVDDVRVVAPAFPQDVKVYGVQGTGFRLDATDHDDRARPGENVTAQVVVIHAASIPGLVRVRITQSGAAAGPDELIQDAWLGPGATWIVPFTFTMPSEGNSVSLIARADTVSPEGNLTVTDPSDRDNAGTLTLDATTVIRYDATLKSMRPLVDDGETDVAVANLTNQGNVPIDLQVHLDESFLADGVNTTTATRDDESVHLEPGARTSLSWSFNGTPRGLHTLNLTTTAPGQPPAWHVAHFYVHQSPPPIFREPGGAHDPNWTAELATMPIPLDDAPGVPGSMWVGRHSDEPAVGTAQHSFPILTAAPTTAAQSSGTTFHDLRLSVRWMESDLYQATIGSGGRLGLSISYTNPTFDTTVLGSAVPVSALVWSSQVAIDPVPRTHGQVDQNLTWQDNEMPVIIVPGSLYVDAWSLKGMQLRATAFVQKETLANESGIFIDDLRLSGVPDGKDESWRTDIIHLTGNGNDGGAPAQPSSCTWNDPTVPPPQAGPVTDKVAPGTSVPVQAGFNCWFPMSAADAVAWTHGQAPGSSPSYWRDTAGGAETLDGAPSAFEYYPPLGTTNSSSDRLVSPILSLHEASDPLITFLHRESFGVRSFKTDYYMTQVGYVELQYRLDDGTWSGFYPLYPDGYGGFYPPAPPLVLANPNGDTRKADAYTSGYDGFFQTGPCIGASSCDTDGSYLGNTINATIPNAAVPMPPPVTRLSSFHLRGQPMLAGVDLSNRDVRLGFRASEQGGADDNFLVQSYWMLRDLRVTPVSVFAMDGAVDNMTLDLPYDWQSMGVGPGTTVPISGYVRNAGQFPVAFELDVNVSRLNGALVNSTTVELGLLAPNESQPFSVPWIVPVGEDTAYSVKAHVRAVGTDVDENDLNDNATLGLDGSLVARTRNDLAIQAQISPELGREGRPRYVSIQVFNHGNEPLTHVTLARDLSLVAGSRTTLVDHTVIDLGATVWPSAEGVRFENLDPHVDGQPYSPDNGFVVPNQVGDYTLVIQADADQAPDATPSDNFYRGALSARTALYAASFDDGLNGWTPTGTPVWGTSEGFRSIGGVAAMNATSGALPPNADGSLLSPSIPVADARAAVINAFVRYDLETRFDGARFEASADNGATWLPLTPVDGGLQQLVGSNPLAANLSPDVPALAFTGDSHESLVNLDGWVPVSFDLATVPGISEDVVFRQVPVPGATSVTTLQTDPLHDPADWHAPWMVPPGADWTGRWEFHNQTQMFPARSGTMWWSGYASHSTADPDVTTLPYYQGTFDVSQSDKGEVTLSWWDMRDGTINSSWKGTGARYQIYAWQPNHGVFLAPKTSNLIPDGQIQVLAREGPWSHLSTTIENVNNSQPLRIRFSFFSRDSLYADLGWGLSDVDLRATSFDNGVATPIVFSTGSTVQWAHQGFTQVSGFPLQPAAWRSVATTDETGLPTSVWNLTVAPHVDTRLVTPAINLGEAGSSSVALNLTHGYNLLDDEANVPPSFDPWTNQRFQGAVVEVSALNGTTHQWDEWKQIFATPDTPGPTPTRPTMPGPVGAPYTATLPDVGDTFQRFPSAWYQLVQSGSGSVGNYYRQRVGNLSYVFSGASAPAGASPYTVDRFDLSPFAGQTIRLGFHAWSGGVDDGKPHWWTISKIEVRGRVLSSPDLLLRARVGTDNSTLQGNFAMDQLEVAGTRYASSLGIELTDQPLRVAPDGTVVIRGNLVNFGPDARRAVGVGLVQDTTPFASSVLAGSTATLPAGSRYAAATFAPLLAPAGEPGSSAPFAFRLTPNQAASVHTVRLEAIAGALGSDGSFAFSPAPDDVPGRAARAWQLQVVDKPGAEIRNATLAPSWLPAPGLVSPRATLVNTGTKPIANATVAIDLFNVNRSRIANETVLVPYLAPGGSMALVGAPLRLPDAGNYTISVRADALGVSPVSLKARVARGDVAYGTDFADDAGTWVPETAANAGQITKVSWRRTDDEHAFGNASMLLGLNDTEVGQGKTLSSWINGSLTSPVIDMRGALPDAAVEFWSKPRFAGNGNVSVLAIAEGGCTRVLGYAPDGSSPQWSFTRLALGTDCGFESGNVTIKFVVANGDGAGWRLGAVTLASGEVSLSPSGLDFPLGDSAVKDFPLLLTNPGAAPKDVSLSLDRLASNLQPSERSWLRMIPDHVTIAPGASMRVTLRASSPAARGSFDRVLSPQVAATSLDEPFVEALAPLTLRFAPLARADLAASLTVDGQPGAPGLRLEEGVPHQIAVSVTNLGTRDSAPTRVKLWITEDATGLVEWTHEETIPALAAGAPLGVDAVVADAWRPDFGHRGNHTIHVLTDPDRVEVDYDHANDGYTVPIRVIQLIRPDLGIDPASLVVRTPTGLVLHEANPGQVVQLSARIVNLGIADAHDVVVRIYEGGAVLREQALGTLAAGQGVDVSATEFAPDNATRFRVQATTPDLELSTSNNERDLDLPIFPPEIQFHVAQANLTLQPGATLDVPVDLVNTGPYPQFLTLTATGDAPAATLSLTKVALAPNESRSLTLTITLGPSEPARAARLVLAAAAEGRVAQRTLDVTVAAHPGADAIVYRAAGPPQALRVDAQLLNTGNTPLSGDVLLEDAAGRVLGQIRAPDVPPGDSAPITVVGELPESTQPGLVDARLVIRQDAATLDDAPVSAQVEPWGETRLDVVGVSAAGRTVHYALGVTFSGNHDSVREPRAYGLPAGARATFDQPNVRLSPGDRAPLNLTIELPDGLQPGMYQPLVGAIDPAATSPGGLLANLTPLSLDLRAGKATLVNVTRGGAGALSAGGLVDYAVQVRNDGDDALRGVPVELYVDGALVARQKVDLAPAESGLVHLAWNATPGLHAIVVAVDPHGAHAGDTAAFGDSLHVAQGPLGAVGSAAKHVPGISPLALLALVALVGRLWRWRRRGA